MARQFSRPNPPPPRALLDKSTLEGMLERVTYSNEDETFKIVRLEVEGANQPIYAKGGLFGAKVGDFLRLEGKWESHAQYGWTFSVSSFQVQAPSTEAGIEAYLSSGLIKGIGPVTAKNIVKTFGDKTLEILTENPERLLEVPKLGLKTAETLAKCWEEHQAEHQTMVQLKEYQLPTGLAIRLIKHYGIQAASVIKSAPHKVGLEVSGIGFHKADDIARRIGIEPDSVERIRAGIMHVLDEAAGDGHTRMVREACLQLATELLGLEEEKVAKVLDSAEEDLLIREVRPDGEIWVFMPVLYRAEDRCRGKILELQQQKKKLLKRNVDSAIDEFEKKYRFQLAAEQKNALRSIAQGGICVLTGGPGTGKTTLIRALIYMAEKENVTYQLCSPTGRAAQRLGESCRRDASTIHRMLKWNAGKRSFTHDAKNPLKYDLIIADEASMLDVNLASILLRALVGGTTVVFVGDIDQLPSVGPGTFLKDLIGSGRVPVTRLSVIFRQGRDSQIITNSHRINQGLSPIFGDPKAKETDFFFVSRKEHDEIQKDLITVISERIPQKFGLDPIRDVQVLTPMRKGELGVKVLNEMLQEALNPHGRKCSHQFRVGDKVIQTSNNYDLDVFNGDIGVIKSWDAEERVMFVQFNGREIPYESGNLDELELAYVITIHKSQGSEYPAVLIPIHTSHFIMLKRNLIYTAITRGKKLVMMFGARKALEMAIRNTTEKERQTALRHWLISPPNGNDLFGGEE